MGRRPAQREKIQPYPQGRERRVELGGFWLWPRLDRNDWRICWTDGGTTRRLSTGIGGGREGYPPIEAEEALAAHFARHARPAEPQQPSEAGVSELLTLWLSDPDTLKLARAGRYAYSVKALERFFEQERRAGHVRDRITLDYLKRATVDRFIAMRKAEGVCGETIEGDLTALRRGLKWAQVDERIAAVPFIKHVDPEDRSGPRDVEFDMEQIAAILEAAAAREDRRHVLLFSLIMLSCHSRCEAVLEMSSNQIERVRVVGTDETRWILNFNAAGRRQTTKRRSRVPACSILRPWLADVEGKVITYRTPIAERKWADPRVPEYFERPCYDIGKAFEACQVEAGLAHPSLKLIRPDLGADGEQKTRLNRRTGQEVALWRGIGTPNTLRHSCHTYHQTCGTPQAQIDMAAGHSGEQGSGRNYTHLRPEYLKDFMAATEAYWEEMGKLTKVHLRDHVGATVIDLGARRR
jgi:hypothetical protein